MTQRVYLLQHKVSSPHLHKTHPTIRYTSLSNTTIKINATKVNVFVSSVNRTFSAALLTDISDHQNKPDVPFNGDRVATALPTHWILPVRG